MNSKTPFALAFCLFATCGIATASPADDIAEMLQRVAASPTKTMTFFQGLAALDDCDVGGEDLQEALEEGGVEAEGLLGAFLNGLQRIRKSGDDVMLSRDETVRVQTGSGLVQVGKEISFHASVNGDNSIKLTKFRGAKAGLGRMTLIPVRTLGLDVDASKLTTASLNVGYGFLSKTVKVVLARPVNGMAAALKR